MKPKKKHSAKNKAEPYSAILEKISEPLRTISAVLSIVKIALDLWHH